MQARGLHHIAIRTGRVAALATFYARVFRLEELRRNVDAEGLYSVWLRFGDAILMIERGAGGPPGDDAGLHLLAFAIDKTEREAWRRHLEREGVLVVGETPYTLYVRDPDGNRIGLSSWPDGATA